MSRLTALCAVLAIPELLLVASGVAVGHVGRDFGAFYAASGLLHAGQVSAIVHPSSLTSAAEAVLGRPVGMEYPWPYPPTALLVMFPLAFVSVWRAYLAAMALGIAAYLSSMVALAGSRRENLLMLLTFPAVTVTIVWGHSSFLTTALFAWALALLPRSPVLAGCAVGLLSFKPHLGVLVPVAFLAARQWTAALSAASTVVVLAAGATIAFGWQPWVSFPEAARAMVSIVESEATTKVFYQSVFSGVRLAGGGLTTAWVAQGIAATAAACVVWRTWSAKGSRQLKGTVLVLGTLVTTPYLCEYDLLLLAIPIALALGSPGALRWPWVVAALMTPALARPFAQLAHVAIVPCVALALLWATLRGARASAPEAQPDPSVALSS